MTFRTRFILRSFATPAPAGPDRRAFTLIELMVVMGIIILLVALALPAFNFITGARSVDASTNQLSAVLSITRADAIAIQDVRGTVIFHDATTGKDAIGEAELRTYPFNNYDTTASSSNPVSYVLGQYAMFTDGKAYVCTSTYTDIGDPTTKPGYMNSAYWRVMSSVTASSPNGLVNGNPVLELRFDREYQTLPTGISIRGAGDTVAFDNYPTNSSGTNHSRYMNPGVCFFDSNGQVVLKQYFILPEGILGHRMGADAGQMTDDPLTPSFSPGTSPNFYPIGKNPVPTSGALQSQIGFVVFDNEQFKNVTQNGSFNAVQTDAWLDQNATPLLVNRFNGTLVKGE